MSRIGTGCAGVLAVACAISGVASAQGVGLVRKLVNAPIEIRATPAEFVEGEARYVFLQVAGAKPAKAFEWSQLQGPRVAMGKVSSDRVLLDVGALRVAADTELRIGLKRETVDGTGYGEVRVVVRAARMEPALEELVQVGGSSQFIDVVEIRGRNQIVTHIGNELLVVSADRPGDQPGRVHVNGWIHDVEFLHDGVRELALLAVGPSGIAVVDLTEPRDPRWLFSVPVDFRKTGLSWTEGGGDILQDQTVEGLHGDIRSLVTDGKTLWIGSASFGVHQTLVSNLVGRRDPVVEPNGSLRIDQEVWLLLYAGENPWGAPLDLLLRDERLFVVQEFLGLVVLDAERLAPVGYYNLYTDVSMHEDWFLDMDVAQVVRPGYLDPVYGMPDYRQASWEIRNAHGSGNGGNGGSDGEPAATPWADFDRYGRYYYAARAVDVAEFPETGRTIAYLAYGLGGLVAVDVTGYQSATPDRPLRPFRLGYAPAVPAHGPDEFIGSHNDNIFPHFGAGMLKEAGVLDVRIFDGMAVFTDHFAGLAILAGAADPAANWRGLRAPYDNDDDVVGDHVPDYEFVTSYDMSPWDPDDHESLPAWMYEWPSLLVTGEIGGHGVGLAILDSARFDRAWGLDLVFSFGAGGFGLLDVFDLVAPTMAERFRLLMLVPTTAEIGAAADGSAGQPISIGHAQGIAASRQFLYLADGPHGVSAWRIADAEGRVIDRPFLVGNALQDEYPVVVNGETILPTPHAHGVVLEEGGSELLVTCQGLGLRRLDVAPFERRGGGRNGPLLMQPRPTDVFEHNGAAGKVHSVPKQDHAYDVVVEGDLAFVADGGNGLTIYDLSKDPTNLTSGFFVANLGGATQSRPELGRSTGIALWHDPATSARYALLAAGPYGVGVVDVTHPDTPRLVKIFEPIKMEDDKVGKADGRCVDVFVYGMHAWFSYDGFGVVDYAIADLIEPLPSGVDPTRIWKVQSGAVVFDHRPVAVAEYRIRDDPRFAEVRGGALGLCHVVVGGRLTVFVAYGTAGVLRLDWTDPARPEFLELVPTIGECGALAVSNGRVYAADGAGGFLLFR